jgi:WD40 repeat protein
MDANPLIDLCFNSVHPERLVLAYEQSGIAVWDFKSNKVLQKFFPEKPVHCCCWSPDGKSLAVGMRDGCIVLWKLDKNPSAYKAFRPDSNAEDLSVSAIDTIFWLPTCLIISGGMPFTSNSQLTYMSSDMTTSSTISLPSNIKPLHLLHTPVSDSFETFLVLSEDGCLLTFNTSDAKVNYVNDLYGGRDEVCSKFYTISNEGEMLSEIITNLIPVNIPKVLCGGEVLEAPSDIYGLLVVGHMSGILRFWSVSTIRIYNILNVSLLSENFNSHYNNTLYQDVSDSINCKISCIEISDKKIVVGFDIGKIAVWDILPQKLNLVCAYEYHTSPVLIAKICNDVIITGDLEGIITSYNYNSSQAIVIDTKNHRKTDKVQVISVTCIKVIFNVVYICISNGSIFSYNPSTQQIMDQFKLPRTDFKSEVPKRSEVGILNLLFTPIQPSLVIICYERSLVLGNLGDFSIKESQYWSVPMISSSVAHIRTDVYVYILHKDYSLSLLNFYTLQKVWQSSLPLPLS